VILTRETHDGAYADATLRADCPTRRYTAYVVYADASIPNGRLLDAVREGDASVEEIDVDAATPRHAREVATAALAADYELGGRIIAVDERIGLYL
jgi:hypothetical protein